VAGPRVPSRAPAVIVRSTHRTCSAAAPRRMWRTDPRSATRSSAPWLGAQLLRSSTGTRPTNGTGRSSSTRAPAHARPSARRFLQTSPGIWPATSPDLVWRTYPPSRTQRHCASPVFGTDAGDGWLTCDLVTNPASASGVEAFDRLRARDCRTISRKSAACARSRTGHPGLRVSLTSVHILDNSTPRRLRFTGGVAHPQYKADA
jgi:hypothetical protein